MNKEKTCTHITWGEGVTVAENFYRACSPAQYREGYMLVLRPAADIRELADKMGQKGLTLEPGTWR